MRIYGIATIGEIVPDGIGQELILADSRPSRKTQGMGLMGPQYFLQKNNIGVGGAYGVAQFVQYETTIEERKSLMRIYGKYF